MTPSAAVSPMQQPPRMCAVDGTPSRVSVNIVAATPPTFFAKRRARSVASSMKALGACVGSSSTVTRPLRKPVHVLRPSFMVKVPSSVRM